jgi:hypothetical protein
MPMVKAEWYTPPPWKLLSPKGVAHVIVDDDALKLLVKSEGLNPSNMRVLIGLHRGNIKPGACKSHEALWVRFADVKWLKRDGHLEFIYTIGPCNSPQHFIDMVAKKRDPPDMPFNNADTLRRFLKGEYKARGKTIETLTDFKWRVVDPTQEALAAVPCKVGWHVEVAHLLCRDVRDRSRAYQACIARGGAWGAVVRAVCMTFALVTFQVVAPMASANGSSLGQVVQ